MTVIRPLRPEDAPQWQELRLEALRDFPVAFSTSFEEASLLEAAAFVAHIPPPDSPSALFGAFDDDRLCGSTGLHVPTTRKLRHKGLLWGVYVRPALARRGIGTLLVRAAIERARMHVTVLQLAVSTENAAARALYRGLGFVPYGVERRALHVDGLDHDNELMAMEFEPSS